jgi:hypothetical protein
MNDLEGNATKIVVGILMIFICISFVAGFIIGIDSGIKKQKHIYQIEQQRCNCCHSPLMRSVLQKKGK